MRNKEARRETKMQPLQPDRQPPTNNAPLLRGREKIFPRTWQRPPLMLHQQMLMTSDRRELAKYPCSVRTVLTLVRKEGAAASALLPSIMRAPTCRPRKKQRLCCLLAHSPRRRWQADSGGAPAAAGTPAPATVLHACCPTDWCPLVSREDQTIMYQFGGPEIRRNWS